MESIPIPILVPSPQLFLSQSVLQTHSVLKGHSLLGRQLKYSLISIFAVHCTTSPLRILNVRLDSDKPFNVWTGSPPERDLICIPNSPAKFIYQITKVGSKEEVSSSVNQGHPLTFVITYRLIEKGILIECLALMSEIAAIVRNRLKEIIQQKGQERLAFRLYDMLPEILKRVDVETFGLFRAILLKEGSDWAEAFRDASQEDQLVVKDIGKQLFEVLTHIYVQLMADFQ